MIELPFFRLPSSSSRCCVCNKYYTDNGSLLRSMDEESRCEALLKHNIFIQKGSTCCSRHLDENQLLAEAIVSIKKTKSNLNIIKRDELLHLLNDVRITLKRFESMLDEANRRPAIDFEDSDRLTNKQIYILTGIRKENFDDLCFRIPSTSLQETQVRSAKQAVGCLLVQLRLGLSNAALATLFSLSDVKTVSRVIDTARKAIMNHFVPNYLGFQHISGRDVINKHTRSLA